MQVNMDYEDFLVIYDAVKTFNEMDDNSDINLSLDLLENAQELLEDYLSQIDPS